MSRKIAAALILTSLCALAPVRADDAAEARFFDELGRRAYARRHWEEALSAFLDAHAAAPSPRTLYNLALSAQLAHHDALAFESFDEYLESGDDDDAQRMTDARTRREALARTLALVHVTSVPAGAEIWVDRRELGSFGRTPRTLVLEPGHHTIELALEEHETAHLEVTATQAHRDDLTAELASYVGVVRVEASPPAATVTLTRGEETRTIASGADVSVPVGAWTLRATLEGYVDESAPLTVTRGQVERRTIVLARVPTPTGRVLVSTGDVHARLSLDGMARTETPARLDGIDVGAHHVRLEADGFVPWEGDVEVRTDRATQLEVTLVPQR